MALVLSSNAALAARCPNILLDFDVSGSMGTDVAGTNPLQNRYVVGRDAVTQLLSGNSANFRYGLILFGTSANSNCGVSACFYPAATCESVLCDYGSTASINAVLAAAGPVGGTPTASSISVAMTRADMQDSTRGRYIILITDGDPNCTNNTVADTVAALTNAKNAGVKTYVLGFAGGSAGNLNQMAVAGGTQRNTTCDTGANKCFYDAANAAELKTALDAIVSAVGGELGGGSCDDTCYGGGCAAGQICKTASNGTPACATNNCTGVSCPTGSTCVDGACKAPCNPACLSNDYCDNGVCKPKVACAATCPNRQTCVNGACVEDWCNHPTAPISCGANLCIDNSCQVFGGGSGGGAGVDGGAGGRDGGAGAGGGTNAGTGCCSGAPGAASLFGLLFGGSLLAAMRRRVRLR